MEEKSDDECDEETESSAESLETLTLKRIGENHLVLDPVLMTYIDMPSAERDFFFLVNLTHLRENKAFRSNETAWRALVNDSLHRLKAELAKKSSTDHKDEYPLHRIIRDSPVNFLTSQVDKLGADERASLLQFILNSKDENSADGASATNNLGAFVATDVFNQMKSPTSAPDTHKSEEDDSETHKKNASLLSEILFRDYSKMSRDRSFGRTYGKSVEEKTGVDKLAVQPYWRLDYRSSRYDRDGEKFLDLQYGHYNSFNLPFYRKLLAHMIPEQERLPLTKFEADTRSPYQTQRDGAERLGNQSESFRLRTEIAALTRSAEHEIDAWYRPESRKFWIAFWREMIPHSARPSGGNNISDKESVFNCRSSRPALLFNPNVWPDYNELANVCGANLDERKRDEEDTRDFIQSADDLERLRPYRGVCGSRHCPCKFEGLYDLMVEGSEAKFAQKSKSEQCQICTADDLDDLERPATPREAAQLDTDMALARALMAQEDGEDDEEITRMAGEGDDVESTKKQDDDVLVSSEVELVFMPDASQFFVWEIVRNDPETYMASTESDFLDGRVVDDLGGRRKYHMVAPLNQTHFTCESLNKADRDRIGCEKGGKTVEVEECGSTTKKKVVQFHDWRSKELMYSLKTEESHTHALGFEDESGNLTRPLAAGNLETRKRRGELTFLSGAKEAMKSGLRRKEVLKEVLVENPTTNARFQEALLQLSTVGTCGCAGECFRTRFRIDAVIQVGVVLKEHVTCKETGERKSSKLKFLGLYENYLRDVGGVTCSRDGIHQDLLNVGKIMSQVEEKNVLGNKSVKFQAGFAEKLLAKSLQAVRRNAGEDFEPGMRTDILWASDRID